MANKASSRMKQTLIIAALCCLTVMVHGHGALTDPPVRPVTSSYYNLLPPGMRTLSEYELQRYPLEFIRQVYGEEGVRNFPQAYSLPCRGIPFSGQNVSRFRVGQSIPMRWRMDAPHQGICEIRLFVGNQMTTLSSTSCARSEGISGVDIRMPNVGDSCRVAGTCFLQFWWDRTVNDESYSNCVDFLIENSSGGDGNVVTTVIQTDVIPVGTIPPPITPPATTTVSGTTSAALATTRSKHYYDKPTKTSSAGSSSSATGQQTDPDEAECTHGNQKCCGTDQEFCTCLFGKWQAPRPLILSKEYKCKSWGNYVTVERV